MGRILLLAFLSGVGTSLSLEAQNALLGESEVKAAYLYNFARFVEWPPEVFPSRTSPILIGILATDQFAAVLEQTVAGKTAQGRSLVVRRLQQLSGDALQCHIVFVSSAERGAVGDLLKLIKGARVLTVSETEGFAERGGTVNFVLSENKVRFEINHKSAETAGLKISSKLLQLATHVWE